MKTKIHPSFVIHHSSFLLLAALLIGACGCGGEDKSQSRPGPMVGKAAPAFRVQGIFNEPYSFETFKGHILVMQFGTSW